MRFIFWILGIENPGNIDQASLQEIYSQLAIPGVVIGALVVIGIVAAGLNFLPRPSMPWKSRLTLFVLRLLGFGVIILMLLQYEARIGVVRSLPPEFALLEDVSGSMNVTDADGEAREKRSEAVRKSLQETLSDEARVTRYPFSWKLHTEQSADSEEQKRTRIMKSIEQTVGREKDLSGIVLLTDGNDTDGDTGVGTVPLLQAKGLPVYPVVMGRKELLPRGDVKMQGAPPCIRLGNTFTFRAMIRSEFKGAQSVTVNVYESDKSEPVATRTNLTVRGDEPVQVAFSIRPESAGRKEYTVKVKGFENQSADDEGVVARHEVAVIDDPINVLFVDIPRDERKILGHWLSRDPAVSLAQLMKMPKGGWYARGDLKHEDPGSGLPDKEADLYEYDVIVFGDIHRSYFRSGGDIGETKMRWLTEFVTRRGGGLVTLAGRDAYGAGQYQNSPLAEILPFRIKRFEENQVDGEFPLKVTDMGMEHPIMQLAPSAEETRKAWLGLPVLNGLTRVGKPKPGATLLATGNPSGQDSTLPVMAVQNVGKGSVLSLAVDTTWRWQMMRPEKSPDYYRRFWGNAVRYLAPDPRLNPESPHVTQNRSNISPGETVRFQTRLVDSLYEPIQDADLEVEVQPPSGQSYTIYPDDGRNEPGLYVYKVTPDEPGNWQLKAEYGDTEQTKKFKVGDSMQEMDSPRAYPDVMSTFAEDTGGKMYRPDEVDALANELSGKERKKSVTYTVALWNLPLTLIVFLLVVAADCYIRKRRGMV